MKQTNTIVMLNMAGRQAGRQASRDVLVNKSEMVVVKLCAVLHGIYVNY